MRHAALVGTVALLASIGGIASQGEEYLRWSADQAESIGRSAYKQGRVGGVFDTRILKTERSYNYKLAATWLTADVIRATARQVQLRNRLDDGETRRLVEEADKPSSTIVMVEIDPREGSGVIPDDWEALLGPKERPDVIARGKKEPGFRELKALAGVLRRNYDYDRFWVAFPVSVREQPLFVSGDRVAQLTIRIHDKEGRVEWPIPSGFRLASRQP